MVPVFRQETDMRKMALMSVISFFIALLLTVTAWAYEQNPCVRNAEGKIACPPQGGACLMDAYGNIACSPPFGGIVRTYDGRMLCGPGACGINAAGEIFCSAEMGGSMTFDAFGKPFCTGSCVPASEPACSRP
jgi:hypothetical protein